MGTSDSNERIMRDGFGASRRATVAAWVLFAVVSAYFAGLLIRDDFRHHPVIGDATAYLMQAESMGYAGHDLAYDQRDVDRFRSFRWADQPYGLYFQRHGDGWAFAKPYGYSVVLAPSLRLFGPRHGVTVANLAIFAALGLVGAAALRLRYRGAVVPLVLGSFLYGSPLIFYAFHIWLEVFWALLTMIVFYALVRGTRDRNVPWVVVGFGVSGLMLSEKAPAIALLLPILVVAAWQLRGWRPRALAGGALLAVFVVASLPYFVYSDHQSWTPYGGERYYAGTGVPFDAGVTGGYSRVRSDETFSVAYVREQLGQEWRVKATATLHYVVGRHTGLLAFTPFALFLLVLALTRVRRADRLALAVLAGVLGYIAFYVILFPHNYSGGGQTLGNRYFLQIYPAVLFLPVTFRVRPKLLTIGAVASAAVALVFLFHHYRSPSNALRDIDRTNRVQQLLPFESNQDGANYFRCGANRCPAP